MQPDTEIRTEPTDPRQDLVIRCPATGEVVGSGTDDAGCRARRSPAGWRWTGSVWTRDNPKGMALPARWTPGRCTSTTR